MRQSASTWMMPNWFASCSGTGMAAMDRSARFCSWKLIMSWTFILKMWIAAEDRHQLGLVIAHQVEVLEHRVGGALVPVLAGALLGRHRADEVVAEHRAEIPGLLEMLGQALALELREHVDPVDPRVDQVREREVDDAVFASERYGGFGAGRGEGLETSALTTGHDECENLGAHNVLEVMAYRVAVFHVQSYRRQGPFQGPSRGW